MLSVLNHFRIFFYIFYYNYFQFIDAVLVSMEKIVSYSVITIMYFLSPYFFYFGSLIFDFK